jgi:hypothetical protein
VAIDSPQTALFDLEPSTDSVYFLTNRNNLLRVLATGMLMPKAGFPKYYDDLLRLAPGRLPILGGTASSDVVSMVMPEAQTFPVMLELSPSRLSHEDFPALMADGSYDRAGWGNPDAQMWAPSGVIPVFDTLTAIHFRSDVEREEFEVREFEDARPRHDLHRVTPRLFEAPGPSVDSVTRWLASLEPIEEPSVGEIVSEDRRSGAVLLGCLTAVASEDELRGWGHILAGGSPEKQAGEVVSRIGRILAGAPKIRDPEDVALQVCLEELAATNRLQTWRPVEVLERIQQRLAAQLKSKANPMLPVLDRATAILRDEEVFEGLNAGGSPTLKALLLTLKRPEPERMIGWDPGGPGSTPDVLNLAAVMVGSLTGRALMPVSHRDASLDAAVSRVEAERLSPARDRAMAPFKAPSVDVELLDTTVRVKLDDGVVIERPITRPAQRLAEIDASMLQVARVRERAVSISVRNGWADAIESIVEASTADIKTTLPVAAGGPVTMRLGGIATVRHDLVIEGFLRHVENGDLLDDDRKTLTDT